MKILFAIKSLNVVGGGAENVLVQVANGLSRRGHEIGILTFDAPGQSFYDLDSKAIRFDLDFNEPGHPTSPVALVKAIPRIRKTFRKFNADRFVPFMHSTFIPLALATWGVKKSTIYSEHIDYSHYQRRPRQYKLLKRARKSTLATTVPSVTAFESYPAEDRMRMVVIPNPVPRLAPGTSGAGSSTDAANPVFLSVGGLRTEKDHAVLIDAFALIAEEFPDWTLRIIGEGVLRPELEQQITATGLGDRVEMPGSTRTVEKEYEKARFVVLPSQYESFGLVAAEALGAGKAVLSFAECAGVSEMVENEKNGVLVRGGATHATRRDALAEGLRRLMSDPDACRRLGAAGPASIERYGIEPILDQWEALLSTP